MGSMILKRLISTFSIRIIFHLVPHKVVIWSAKLLEAANIKFRPRDQERQGSYLEIF